MRQHDYLIIRSVYFVVGRRGVPVCCALCISYFVTVKKGREERTDGKSEQQEGFGEEADVE